ncbi:kinesin domain-containing protein [Pholiota conissans]|uniref:Kinesin domain-containing protein n=1 Tax=Pholiota conissans TaxID=109636 RepID=A0A9P5Z8C0_9AGAR|nr:kinesin domain-containing protein [Pholiota conissans]
MAPSSSSSAAATSVQVALRIRPPTTQDSTSIPARFQRSVIQATSSTSISIEATSAALAGSGQNSTPAASAGSGPKKQLFTFDQVHPPPTTQYEIYDSTARPLVSRFIEGFNCTILAYGQTSSGKTFTMTGVDLDMDPSDPNNNMGIIPRAVSSIFASARQLKEERGGAWNYNLKGSFVELYNEDLIDLLGLDDPNGGARREVQIREDKEGHIIWGGLREVNVKNANEVMSLIKKGTSIRRTNETDMNAQSSRSHAIFSLTLTQKKYTGAGHPPRSSSPLPPGGRSPSRLARPGSMYAGGPSPISNRVASPTLGGRPSTPSFASAMNRGGGLRPASALGHMSDRSTTIDEESGEWVTIVSKFHFVDLAGSERLKRTAAAGERIKEGISINSGLLALGNVISALGDPSRAKSNTATHIPYRDSKLTRLLQDSLGGNAHTLMIACVSPAEWNAAETINTLKYANRARNIKNRAVVNEKEDGWDDIEWLQGTVSRLRKELKVIKEGGALPSADRELEMVEGAGKKVLARMNELQNSYEDLREKFVERTEELTRLRRELGERHRISTSGAVGGTGKYEEIVGPVIEEYEKTISAMEAELSLNRAALRHTNEMVEEKEEELAVITERHAATELYVEELRSRVAKLTEREASTEAYVRDLEEKMKAYDETSVSSSESMTDLKREVSRFKDAEAHSSKYISDLEARLARADESILSLQQTVEKLEKESDRRREEVETLQCRLEAFRQDGESWRTELEARELKVKQLEIKMQEWEQKRKEAGETRARLGSVVGEVASARRSLEIDLGKTPSGNVSSTSTDSLVESGSAKQTDESPAVGANAELESQLLALQQTHTATLADLSSVTAKYRDALHEISDLAAQIQEAKLGNPAITDGTPSIAESIAESTDSPVVDKPTEIPPFRRRINTPRMRDAADIQVNSAGRRLFFRQAASAESLHARSLSQSLSLSQELSSAHLRKASFSSHGTGSSHSPSNSHSLSVSHSASASLSLGRPNLSISMPSLSSSSTERSVSSLEKEIMRLQEVLKDRETEISLLEESLKESQSRGTNGDAVADQEVQDVDGVNPDTTLSPKTLNRFDHIRKTMEGVNGNGTHMETSSSYSEDESLERLNELMLSMAQKESHHREVVDELNAQLTQTRRQLDDLTALSRDQTLNMSKEIEALQKNHGLDLALLEEVREREAQLLESLKEAEVTHKLQIDELRAAHEEAIKLKAQDTDKLLISLKKDHESIVSGLHDDLGASTAALKQAQVDHESAITELQKDHEKNLQAKLQETQVALQAAQAEHEKALTKIQTEHAAILRQKEEEGAAALQVTEEEYYNALTKLRGDHAEAIKTVAAETNATIERLREEHAGELRMAEIARDGTLSESESSLTAAMATLQEEHIAAITRKEAAFTEEIESLNAGFLRASKAKDDDHELKIDRLKLEHETAVSKMKSDWRTEIDRLTASLAEEKEAHASAAQKLSQEKESAIQLVQEQQAVILQEIEKGYQVELSSLKEKHDKALAKLVARNEEDRECVLQSRAEEVAKLKSQQHEEVIAKLDESLFAVQDMHQQALEDARAQNKDILLKEQARLAATLADLQEQHAEERETFRKDHDLLVEELEAHKVAADEFTMLREQARQTHEEEMKEKSQLISSMEQDFINLGSERDELENEVRQLRAELGKTRSEQSKLIQEASKRESLVIELERHRSVLAELQENLQKVKDEKDVLQTEKYRSETLVRELQAQLARSASPPNGIRSPDRNIGFQRGQNLPAIKLPPPTPPPSVPPPPAPRSATVQHINGDSNLSTSSQGSAFNSSISSRESQPESPSTSIGHLPPINGIAPLDPKVTAKIEQQSKLIDEQEAMIKTLNKQLTHCESDLQTHMDLVTTLETSLGDSEKNLRKARMQATEIARERDTLNVKLEALRNELSEAKREVVSVRRSIVEEKQSLEQRLDEERKAKERARQQLDSRMEELQRRKSKFACL